MMWVTMDSGRFDQVGALGSANPVAAKSPLLTWLKGWIGSEGVLSIASITRDNSRVKIAGTLLLDRLQRILDTRYVITEEVETLIAVLRGRIGATDTGTDLLVLRQNLIDVSQADPFLKNLTDLCSQCEGDRVDPECIAESLRIIGGYKNAMRIRSPVQTVIPADKFERSNRAREILQQLIVSRAEAYTPSLRSQCVIEWTQ